MTARVSGDAAESFLPVVRPTQVAPTQTIATHGGVDVAALDVTTIEASGGGDMWVGAGSARWKGQPLMKSLSERQRYELTGMISR
jgi:hypothetical protein